MPILEETEGAAEFIRDHLPPRVYNGAICVSIERIRIPSKFPDNKEPDGKSDMMRWTFEIASTKIEGKIYKFEGLTSCMWYAPKEGQRVPQMWAWACAILGSEPNPKGFDTDNLLGIPCGISLKDRKKGDTVYSMVDDIVSLGGEA